MQPVVWGALRVFFGFFVCLSRIRQTGSAAKTAITTVAVALLAGTVHSAPAKAELNCPLLAIASSGLATTSFRADAITRRCGRFPDVPASNEYVVISSADNKAGFNNPLRVTITARSNNQSVTPVPVAVCTGLGCKGFDVFTNRPFIDVNLGAASVVATFLDSNRNTIVVSFRTEPNDDTLRDLKISGGKYDLPLPKINSINPASALLTGGTTVTINGTDLLGATAVSFGGIAATNVVAVSGTQIRATTAAGSAGSKSVRITTPNGSTTTPNAFSYDKLDQAPLTLSIGAPQLNGSVVNSPLTASGGSGTGALTFSVSSGAAFCSISGNILSENAPGQCIITATKAADSQFNAETVSKTIDAGRSEQSGYTVVASPTALSVGNTSNLSAQGGQTTGSDTFSLVSGGSVCSLSGSSLTGTAAGTCVVRAERGGDATFQPATAEQTIHVSSGSTSQSALSGSAASSALAVGQTTVLSSTGGSGSGAVQFAVTSGAAFCAVNGTTLSAVGAGNCTVTVTKAGDTTFRPATATIPVTVSKGAQAPLVITAMPAGIALNETTTLSTTGGSGTGAVSFTIISGASNCSIVGNTLTGVGNGQCLFTGTKAEDANYFAVTDTHSVTVSASSQTISFNQPADLQHKDGGTHAILNATATSGYPVTFTSTTPAVCTVSGNRVTSVAKGICTVKADQSGDIHYAPAHTRSRSFAVRGLYTSVSLTASSKVVKPGEDLTLTATVSPATAVGTFTFLDGATVLCDNVPHVAGVAACTFPIARGHRRFSARFNGTGEHATTSSSDLKIIGGVPVLNTVKTTARFLSRRASMLFNSMFGGSRQIDRLRQAESHAQARRNSHDQVGNGEYVSRLSDGPSGSDFARQRAGRAGRAAFDNLAGLGLRGASFGDESASRRTALPFSVSASTDGPNRFGFSASLSEIRRQNAAATSAKARNALGMTYDNLDNPRSQFNPFDIWVEGKYSSFSDDHANANIDGYFGSVTIGADYVVNPALLFGVFAEFDTMEQTSATEASTVSGNGWLAGAYATMKLRDDLFWQTRGGWGHANNEISPDGTYRSAFDSTRWLIASKLTGRWDYQDWLLQPEASVSYMEEIAKGYTDPNGLFVPQVRTQLGEAKIGPVVSYRYETASGTMIEPRFGMHAVWNFASGTNAEGYGEIEDGSSASGVRGRTELGLRAVSSGGVGLDLSGSYDGIGHDTFSAMSGRATVRVPLN